MDKNRLFLGVGFLIVILVFALVYASSSGRLFPETFNSSLPKNRELVVPKITLSPEVGGWQRFESKKIAGFGFAISYPPKWVSGPPVGAHTGFYKDFELSFSDPSFQSGAPYITVTYDPTIKIERVLRAFSGGGAGEEKVAVGDTVAGGITSKHFYSQSFQEVAVPIPNGGTFQAIGYPGSLRRSDFDFIFDRMIQSINFQVSSF